MAEERPKERRCTLPGDYEMGFLEAILSEEEYPVSREYATIQSAAAAAMIEADLIQATFFDPPGGPREPGHRCHRRVDTGNQFLWRPATHSCSAARERR